MAKQKAFWLALATVGIPSILIWGFLFFRIGFRLDEWPTYAFFIFVPACCLIPLLYRRYLKGTDQKIRTKDDCLKSAIITGCLAFVYLLDACMDPQPGWHGASHWINTVVWCGITALHLWNASKAEKTRYIAHE